MIDDDALRSWLEQVLAERLADRLPLAGLERERLPHIGSYDCERVTVELRDGHRIVLFLKDFARSRLSKDDPELRRLRELRVYRDLLDGAGLGTPRYYGSVWDESRQRCWLLLELFEGEVVKELNESQGVPAAAWLARMQRHFLDHAPRLRRCELLVEHDASYFGSKADAARRDVAGLAPECASRLAAVLAGYEQRIDLMTAEPRSLVHGGYIPWHILVDEGRDPVRVCVVDWELAARGSTLFDLAIFADDAPPSLQDRLYRAYRAAAVDHGVPVPDEAAMRCRLLCFRLHRVVDWLSRSVEKEFPAKKVDRLVTRAEALMEAIETGT